MPVVLLIVGAALIAAGLNDKLADLKALVKEDFAPSGNAPSFQLWGLAIFAIGAIGYYKPLRPVSYAMLALVFVAIILRNGGFFDEFYKVLKGK